MTEQDKTNSTVVEQNSKQKVEKKPEQEAEKNVEKNVEKNAKKTAELKPKNITEKKVSANKSSSGFGAFFKLLSLISFIAVGLLAYLAYLQLTLITERVERVEQAETNKQSEENNITSTLRRDLESLQSKMITSQLQQHKNTQAEILALTNQLAVLQTSVDSKSSEPQNEWLLAEADYLLRFASNRLLLERDIVTSLSLLKAADARIQLIDEASMQAVRAALARDIAQLRSLPKEDLVGISMRLAALFPQIESMPIHSFELPKEVAVAITDDGLSEQSADRIDDQSADPVNVDETEKGWWDNFKLSMQELGDDWFDVRHHGQEVLPLINTEQESIIRSNVSLLLQNAHYATLRQETELYSQSLFQITEVLNRYFDANNTQVIAFKNEIEQLGIMTVKADLAKSLESQLLISQLLQSKTKSLGQQSTATPEMVGSEQ